jgi:hypothetical protein
MSIETISEERALHLDQANLALFGLCLALVAGDGKAARKACVEGAGALMAAGLGRAAHKAADTAELIRRRDAAVSAQ